MHHQIQLIALLIQLVVQASAFQFETKDAGERVCARLKTRGLVALRTGRWMLLGTQDAQKVLVVAQWVPAAFRCCAAQAGIIGNCRGQGLVVRPLRHQSQRRRLMLIALGYVEGQAFQVRINGQEFQLLFRKFQKPIGEMHRRNRVAEYRRVAGS